MVTQFLPMFSRRTIQRLLDELGDTLSKRALTELTARLMTKKYWEVLPITCELVRNYRKKKIATLAKNSTPS
jgi:hypothetical protein